MAALEKAFGYQNDKMNLPVKSLAMALPFYENVLGFKVVSRSESPHKQPCSNVTRSRSDLQKTVAIPARTAVPFT